jgi:hypothetical protein
MKEVVIIVPTYKEFLTETEEVSLNQLIRVLGEYDIYFICPKRLNAKYLNQFRVKRFENSYFEGIEGYNRLMMSEVVYSQFSEYRYMLIYQLDAFVFDDRLMEFCDYGYDYIGAPWITGYRTTSDEGFRYVNVGNGGFSLRKISACIQVIRKHKEELMTFDKYEDLFFALKNGNDFNVAPIDIALKFSFEREVRECYKLNHNQLPFGCHAWEKHDFYFWKPIFRQYGYENIHISGDGNLDIVNEKEYKQLKLKELFWSDDAKLCIENHENMEILIWGTGIYGRRMLKILKNAMVKCAGFIDNNIENCGKKIEGIEVYSPIILNDNERYLIIIAIYGKAEEEVKNQIMEMGKIYMKDFILYEDTVCL